MAAAEGEQRARVVCLAAAEGGRRACGGVGGVGGRAAGPTPSVRTGAQLRQALQQLQGAPFSLRGVG